ncbi:hypothetical protein K402DRAFT_248817 [Aulographum hederae CBS 113979]|uniref:Uncharacterized protein n=1 Tax=Aulographum hederae CBS 113979 TaxID=1176131 RepID=A0A6G1HAR4_9PEZI|nr:hypothetical protein K402DRAFT_248817 [Aulographum hederae CBS 113979]
MLQLLTETNEEHSYNRRLSKLAKILVELGKTPKVQSPSWRRPTTTTTTTTTGRRRTTATHRPSTTQRKPSPHQQQQQKQHQQHQQQQQHQHNTHHQTPHGLLSPGDTGSSDSSPFFSTSALERASSKSPFFSASLENGGSKSPFSSLADLDLELEEGMVGAGAYFDFLALGEGGDGMGVGQDGLGWP